MALIKCPECGKEVSDKAEVCIHCGYPLKPQEAAKEEDGPETVKEEPKPEDVKEEPEPEGTAGKQEPAKKQGRISSTLLAVIVMIVLCVVGYWMMNRLAYGG